MTRHPFTHEDGVYLAQRVVPESAYPTPLPEPGVSLAEQLKWLDSYSRHEGTDDAVMRVLGSEDANTGRGLVHGVEHQADVINKDLLAVAQFYADSANFLMMDGRWFEFSGRNIHLTQYAPVGTKARAAIARATGTP